MKYENKVWSWIFQFCVGKKLDPTVKSNWERGEREFKNRIGAEKLNQQYERETNSNNNAG